MKISDAISRADALSPNGYDMQIKVSWLSSLDMDIFRNIIQTHEDSNIESFDGYKEDTPLETELIAEAPYDDMYVPWLIANIHFYNDEIDRYNNQITRYNELYTAYGDWYNRTHIPKSAQNIYF